MTCEGIAELAERLRSAGYLVTWDDALPERARFGLTPAPPRLLGMWDNILFAYKDRSRVIPDEYRKLVIRVNGDSLPPPAGERLAGLGRGSHPPVRPPRRARTAVYSRYDYWWDKLPKGERRLLPPD